jgi:5-methylcytosine-specific restriction endonuclease McrA
MQCYYCNRCVVKKKQGNNGHHFDNESTRDHLIPKHRGGLNMPNNIVRCCNPCNMDKGMLTLAEYRVVIAFRKGMIAEAEFKFPGENK